MDTKVAFTKTSVVRLACPQDRSEVIFWDHGLAGFGLRCLRSGARRYIVQYRTSDGVQRRARLGDPAVVRLDDARGRARQLLARVQLGEDPQAERLAARQAARVSELVDDYLAMAGKRLRPRSLEETKRHLRLHAKPVHNRPAGGVDRREITELLAGIAERAGGVTANRVRSSLSAMWTWAIMAGRLRENPVAMTRKPASETSRERVLSDTELAAIWRATASGADHDRIVRLLMLTGARRDEVGRMMWAELHGDLWTLPAARTKNGLPHEIPMPAIAVAQLPPRQIERENGAEKAIPRESVFGEKDTGFSGWSRCKARLDGRLSDRLAQMFQEKHGRSPYDYEARLAQWTLHDLRRTIATWLSEHGELPHIVEALLNHVSGEAKRGVAGTYNRALYRDRKRAALSQWAAHISEIVGEDAEGLVTAGELRGACARQLVVSGDGSPQLGACGLTVGSNS